MNTTYIANQIKERLESKDVLTTYGIEVNSRGFAVCPFHNEKTASFKVYNGSRGYYCFGCGESGDVIDFVERLFNIPFNEALQKLNQDFGLGLPIGERLTYRKRLEMSKRAYDFKKNKQDEQQEYDRLKKDRQKAFDKWSKLEQQKREYEPKTPDEPVHPLFFEAIININQAEFELECAETRLYQYEQQRNNSSS